MKEKPKTIPPLESSREISLYFLQEIDDLKQQLREEEEKRRKFASLIDVTSIITASLDKKEVLKRILKQTKVLMNCEKSSILLVDSSTNQLKFEVLTDEKEMTQLKDIRLSMGEGVAGKVWECGRSILIKDTEKDTRFSDKADKQTKDKTESLLASPLVIKGNIIGVMEAMNKQDNTCFTLFDMEVFENLAMHAAVAIENAELYKAGISDRMTKLYNHEYFHSTMEAECKRAIRYKLPLALVIFDIDHFKNFNDNYGHQLGDQVLIQIASLIKKQSREQIDISCRYGGEEFTVILPGTDKKGAMIFAERIRTIVDDLTIEHEGKEIPITISGGVASMPEHTIKQSSHFIRLADLALYHAKNSGRNRVCFYDPSMEEG